MEQIKYFCDKCNKEVKTLYEIKIEMGTFYRDKEFELCEDCRNNILKICRGD